MITCRPVITRANYVSSFFSGYNNWFRQLGHPLLDIIRYDDGEWSIIQCQTSPIIPCLTKWNHILTGLRNIEISTGFVEKYVQIIDLAKDEFWDNENAKTQRMEDEKDLMEENALDKVDRAHKAIINNPDLMNRIGKFGLGQMDLHNIIPNIPRARL